jgi:hypothetical protein
MKSLIKLVPLALVSSVLSNSVLAQSDEDFHPMLSTKFNIDIGVFWPQVDFNIQVDGSDPGEDIDLDQMLKFSNYQSSAALDFRWRYGEKWSLWGQAWSTNSSGKEVLDEDITWEDTTFKEGSLVRGSVGMDVVRVFTGREFFTKAPQHEFGAGLGLHWMSLGTFLEGEILTEDNDLTFERVSVNAEFPLPNIGAWYMYSWSPKWMLQTRIDWLSVNFGDYSGSLWDAQVGLNYQAFSNVGFGLYYKGFILDLDVDKGDWHGHTDFNQTGPMLTINASW